MIGSEHHFAATLGIERARALLRGLRAGEEEAHSLAVAGRFTQATTEPQVRFDIMTRHLEEGEFATLPGIRQVVSKGQVLWIIDEVYSLRVKQLDRDYIPNVNRTDQQARISDQLALDGLPDWVYVTAGPRYSSLTGLVSDWNLARHYRDHRRRLRVEWHLDLDDLARGEGETGTPTLLPTGPSSPSTEGGAVISLPERGSDDQVRLTSRRRKLKMKDEES